MSLGGCYVLTNKPRPVRRTNFHCHGPQKYRKPSAWCVMWIRKWGMGVEFIGGEIRSSADAGRVPPGQGRCLEVKGPAVLWLSVRAAQCSCGTVAKTSENRKWQRPLAEACGSVSRNSQASKAGARGRRCGKGTPRQPAPLPAGRGDRAVRILFHTPERAAVRHAPNLPC